MIRGHLKILALKFLSESPMSGSELMSRIKKATGIKPSPGSIYPMLDSLSEEHLVKAEEGGKSIRYSLTPKGRIRRQEIENSREELVEKIKGMAHILDNLCDEKDSKYFDIILDHIKTGNLPLAHLQPELSYLKNALITKSFKKNKNTSKIKEILKDSAGKIEGL